MDSEQIWVKSAVGSVWGPLTVPRIEAMISSGVLTNLAEASRDGLRFVPIEQDEALRALLGRALQAGDVRQAAVREDNALVDEAILEAEGEQLLQSADAALLSSRVLQAAPPQGRLETTSPLRLYYLIAAAEAGGLLALGEGQGGVEIFFKQGTPQLARCAALGLGAYLVDQRVLTLAQLQGAAHAIEAAHGDVTGGLFAAGLLNPSVAFPHLQQHALTVLARGLSLEEGPFTYDPAVAMPAAGFPLGNRWQLLASGARRLDRLSLRRRLEDRSDLAPRLVGSVTELQLTAQETRLLALLDGRFSLTVLASRAANEVDALLRLLVLLSDLDRVTWEAATEAAPIQVEAAPPPQPTAVTPPAPVRVAPAAAPRPSPRQAPAPAQAAPERQAPPPPSAAVAVDLVQLLVDLQSKDLFARLGLQRTKQAPPNLKATYFQLAKIYHPDTVGTDAPPQLRKLKEDILSLLNEAYHTLADDTDRLNYLEDLEARESGAADIDVEAVLRAEDDFLRGTLLFRARKYAEARAVFEECAALNPREGEFLIWLGYSKFLTATDKRAAHAESIADVKHGLELSPRCAVAFLYLGHMAKLLEQLAEAKGHYERTLSIEPENVDAQRELRLMEQRKRGPLPKG